MIEVKKLVSNIDEYLAGKLSSEELEQLTLGIIADDDFDSLDSEVQDAIYTLDSKELNNLSLHDIRDIRDILSKANLVQ